MNHNDDAWAVFWCSILGPILLEEVPAGERRRFLKALSQKEHLLPNGKRKRVSLSTLRRKVREFRGKKIDGLRRQPRADRGAVRRKRDELLKRAVQLKREQPRRSPHTINKILEVEFGRTIPKSTMNRHFHRVGATRRKLADPDELPKIRCRWTREQTNALWVGDFAEGPIVFEREQSIKSHLSIWIDCHSRYVIEGRYYYRENLDILLDSLLRAWGGHGASRQLYVDNAKVYHSGALSLACAQLNIELLHRPPRDPAAGGLVERVIQTVQQQFEAEVRAGKVLGLDKLNRYFQGWLHADYHQRIHSATSQTPQARYEQNTRFRRHVNLPEVMELFKVKVKRKVNDEFCDVQIDNRFFRVDAKYRDDWVLVSYDPFSWDDEVRLTSLEGQFLGLGKRYDRERGAHGEPEVRPKRTPLDHAYLKMLAKRHESDQDHQGEKGPTGRQSMPLQRFAAQFSKLLGRKGGVSALSSEEMEQLAAVHRAHDRIDSRLLEQACQMAETKTIAVIVFHLQNLLQKRDQ